MREARTLRPYLFFGAALLAFALVAFLFAPQPSVHAQASAPVASQLTAGRVSSMLPADGFYFVNDDFKFTIARKYGVTLMRFAGDDEVFVLSMERAALGGRVLKYDTGDVALQVTGYGGVTIYTSTAPGGLPAERAGNGEPMEFPVPTMTALRIQAQKFADKLHQTNELMVSFSLDWSRLDDGAARYLALDTMRNITRALSGLCANHANQSQLASRLRVVRIMRGDRPSAIYRSGVMTVTFAPVLGLRGRLSSLALARAIRIWL